MRYAAMLGATMTASAPKRAKRNKVLRHFGQGGVVPPLADAAANHSYGLAVPVEEDLKAKEQAMADIARRLFVTDAGEPHFESTQRWIEACGQQVKLPLNFCGGLLIMRLYRLIAPPPEQVPEWMSAVHEAAAAYDFAFLALGHADDEADMTLVREGAPTRFITHPYTRAVDGINMLLSGVAAMQGVLDAWPRRATEGAEITWERHPLAAEIISALTRALKEASFPILLDRAGLGHVQSDLPTNAGLTPILIDAHSLERVEAFTRHRAHSYFMRATDLAALLAGFTKLEPNITAALDELFSFWGLLGAATDDLQDIFIDFSGGIHSVCTVLAHLCVAEDESLRPIFRRDIAQQEVRGQRNRLADLFGVTDEKSGRAALVRLLDEIGLRRALTEHFEAKGALFAAAIYKAAFHFGFSAKLMIEIVSVVCRDPKFSVPDIYLSALESITDETVLAVMNAQVGKFITAYFVERFWPTEASA